MGLPLYIGFDLSTQQLKAIVVDSSLKKVAEAKFSFDDDARGDAYAGITKGVLTNEAEGEVFAPVAMWLQAIDTVLQRLHDDGVDLGRVRGLSGAGMQHGSVFWSHEAAGLLASLDAARPLEAQLAPAAFAHAFSPNWQDASTARECAEFDAVLDGAEAELAAATGSKAHHRFTGPQILRFRRKHPAAYARTSRISLVSSWLASVFLGRVAPLDTSDVCGMNLWDIGRADWHPRLLALAAKDGGDVDLLKRQLGTPVAGGTQLGRVSAYFVRRYGFDAECAVVASTGDNPATMLALPLRPNDAIVSLGTSTTFLMSTPEYRPDAATHFFNHPTTPGLYMFMLCYKNGALAREKVRDAVNAAAAAADDDDPWANFDHSVRSTPPLARSDAAQPMQLGLYFPRPEIIPPLPAGEWHYSYEPAADRLTPTASTASPPRDDARVIVESQFLSLRLRSKDLVKSPTAAPTTAAQGALPPQPRRVYLVGGGSRNRAIAQVAGQVLGGSEGVWKLDVGENACALGAAYKAVWAVERRQSSGDDDDTFDDLIGRRWREADFAERIADGYERDSFAQYGRALRAFARMEDDVTSRCRTALEQSR